MLFMLLVALTVFAGCSRSDDGNSTPVSQRAHDQPSLSGIKHVGIVPNPMVRTTPLTVLIERDGTQGESSSYRYQWFVNKIAVQGATASSFDASTLHRGDRIHVVVTRSDVKGEGGSLQASPVTVPNAPPVIRSVALEQEVTSAGNRLLAKVEASDADQDDIQFQFRWLRNDKLVSEGSENTVVLSELAQSDIVTVEATPYDSDGAGKPLRAAPLVVGNNPPKILSVPLMMSSGELYEYAVRAEDPDGDPVSFELEGAPSGMTIDRAAGQVVWRPGVGISGTHHVKIIVADGKGARAWQEFDVSVPTTPQSP
jgi:Putative Ig domain